MTHGSKTFQEYEITGRRPSDHFKNTAICPSETFQRTMPQQNISRLEGDTQTKSIFVASATRAATLIFVL
jgi:hypothetical protein